MSKQQPKSGNTASRAFEKELNRVGVELMRFDQSLDRRAGEDQILLGVSIRSPIRAEQGDWLVTVRANINGVPCVAFVGHETLIYALNSMAAKWMNGSLKWREDSYAR